MSSRLAESDDTLLIWRLRLNDSLRLEDIGNKTSSHRSVREESGCRGLFSVNSIKMSDFALVHA